MISTKQNSRVRKWRKLLWVMIVLPTLGGSSEPLIQSLNSTTNNSPSVVEEFEEYKNGRINGAIPGWPALSIKQEIRQSAIFG